MQGIKFNQDGITAILEGRKTMTRRPIKVRTDIDKQAWIDTLIPDYCKYKIGETVFVRETFVIATAQFNNDGVFNYYDEPVIHYKADKKDLTWFDEWEDEINVPWRPSTHMNKEISRIFLKITNIKVERLQDISEEDCIKEGVKEIAFNWNGVSIGSRFTPNTGFEFSGNVTWERAKECFKEEIWNKLPYQAPYYWNSNPYVFVYEFEIVQ